MKPFLSYGWQPQVMAVEGRHKAIRAGRLRGLRRRRRPGRDARPRREPRPCRGRCATALREYPVPSLGAAAAPAATPSTRTRAQAGEPRLRQRGRRARRARRTRRGPRTWSRLFDAHRAGVRPLRARGVRGARSRCCERILAEDPHNLDAALRLAHRPLRARPGAARPRRRSRGPREHRPRLAGRARPTCALHYARGREWPRAVPLLEQVARRVARSPARAGGAGASCASGRAASARRSSSGSASTRCGAVAPAELVRAGRAGHERGADRRRHRGLRAGARGRQGPLSRTTSSWASSTWPPGACRRRGTRSTASRASHPGYPMALFKRAQVSVLLRRARPGGADRAGAPAGGRHDAPADRAGAAVHRSKREAGSPARGLRPSARQNCNRAATCEAPRVEVRPRLAEGRVVRPRLDVVAGLLVEHVEHVAPRAGG